ncbi:MAG: hypothetical protein PHI97_01345 [Desulfobulbus sp.]|nr:hypothetical protein [Desulfobulbus sp.]
MRNPFLCSVPDWLRGIINDPFRRTLFLALILLGMTVFFWESRKPNEMKDQGQYQISFFYHPQCPHCRAAKAFIPYLKAKYPEISWKFYDTSLFENGRRLEHFIRKSTQPNLSGGVPMTFIGSMVISGFDRPETTGIQIEQAIRSMLNATQPDLAQKSAIDRSPVLDLPILGLVHPMESSLPVLTVVLGLVDGFNPCAMWVLVYLISIIVNLHDRRKIWLLVGTFIASSGILYFLFMTAWLNVFLFLGFLRGLTLIIGLGALGAGILDIREYIQNKGHIVCNLGNLQSKQRTMHRIDRIADAPLSFFTVFSIVVLAFIVNSIEFACSAALPAIYTHTLSLHQLPPLVYYGYILLYTFFFMLDDLIIFSLTVLALDSNFGQRYAGHCRIIGGIILFILGLVMTFRPELLR